MTLDLDAMEDAALAPGQVPPGTNFDLQVCMEERDRARAAVLALAEAYKNVCWDLAVHTFQGQDISLGEEAEAHRRLYLSREPAEEAT